jgi:hypothetical protein
VYALPGQGRADDPFGKAGVSVTEREMTEYKGASGGHEGLPIMTRTFLETVPEEASYLTRTPVSQFGPGFGRGTGMSPGADEHGDYGDDEEKEEEEEEEDMGQARLVSDELDDEGLGEWRLYEHS